jgi:hypothetical protein
MEGRLGSFLWKISVALYLIVNGIMGIRADTGGDFYIIFNRVFKGDVKAFVIIAGVIALIAGIAILLEMLNVQIPHLDTLILIIAIIWAVYVVVEIFTWFKSGFNLDVLQKLAVHLMVLASLLIASKKF